MEPAKTIIEICGGAKSVAKVTDRSLTRVYRWMHSKADGGTGGHIPPACQQRLMEAAKANGWPLRPEHFFIVTAKGDTV